VKREVEQEFELLHTSGHVYVKSWEEIIQELDDDHRVQDKHVPVKFTPNTFNDQLR
jgi:hypothetical protein